MDVVDYFAGRYTEAPSADSSDNSRRSIIVSWQIVFALSDKPIFFPRMNNGVYFSKIFKSYG